MRRSRRRDSSWSRRCYTKVFGANDRALRLYALVAGIGSLGAAALVCIRLGQRETAWVAPLVLALSAALIYQDLLE